MDVIGNKLSVIMVNRETRDLAIASLQSLQAGLNGISCEIFFVDNGSKDGSVDAVKSEFQDVKIIENTENMGFARAINQAIIRCNGEYILLINPDVTIHDNTIEKLVSLMERYPKAGVVSPHLVYPNGSQQDFCSYFPTLTRQFFQLTGLRFIFPVWLRRRFTVLVKEKRQPFEVDWVIGACILIRKKAIENTGRFDEDFFMYGEDLDYCYRLHGNGWMVYVLPDVEVFHIGSPRDILRSGVFKESLIHRTTYLFFKKHRGIILASLLVSVQKGISLLRLFFWIGVFLTCRGMSEKARMKSKVHFSCLKGVNERNELISS